MSDLVARLREAAKKHVEADRIFVTGRFGPDYESLSLENALETLAADKIERLTTWVNDLQAGMSINCVYCGHNYGPDDEVPATMAEVLKEHIAQCPKHPMSSLTAENRALREQLEQFRADAREVLGAYGDHKRACPLRNDVGSESSCTCGWREVILGPGWKMPGGLADENRALRERLEEAVVIFTRYRSKCGYERCEEIHSEGRRWVEALRALDAGEGE